MNVIIGVAAIAKELNITRPTVYKYIKSGMPCNKISSGKYAFDVKEVKKWIMGE